MCVLSSLLPFNSALNPSPWGDAAHVYGMSSYFSSPSLDNIILPSRPELGFHGDSNSHQAANQD